jgi:CDP-diglyceride synthetase
MNNIDNIKKATFLSFLIIVFPGDHVTLINLMVIIIIFLESFSMIGIDSIDMDSVLSLFLSSLSILSLIYIFNKSRHMSIISILVQYVWLIYSFNKNNLNKIYYLLTISLFVLLSLTLVYQLLKKRVIKNINV